MIKKQIQTSTFLRGIYVSLNEFLLKCLKEATITENIINVPEIKDTEII